MKTIVFIGSFFLATILSTSAWSQTENRHPPRPGTVNYVEGQASIDTDALGPNSVGSVDLGEHQSLTTKEGKVEILLAPGVFLRVADNSSVRMISGDVANITVALDKGRAIVEVLTLRRADVVVRAQRQTNIRINQEEASTKLLQDGVYEFDADHNEVRVLAPALPSNDYSSTRIFKAYVYAGSQKKVALTQEQELTLNTGGKPKAHNISTKHYADDFYRWCGLRSGYLSEASVDVARFYFQDGSGWYGSGWYWDSWFDVYTFVPAEETLYSPFGWGFYSPTVVYRSSSFYYGYYPHRFSEFHEPYGYRVALDRH
jgi:hypothetical protein